MRRMGGANRWGAWVGSMGGAVRAASQDKGKEGTGGSKCVGAAPGAGSRREEGQEGAEGGRTGRVYTSTSSSIQRRAPRSSRSPPYASSQSPPYSPPRNAHVSSRVSPPPSGGRRSPSAAGYGGAAPQARRTGKSFLRIGRGGKHTRMGRGQVHSFFSVTQTGAFTVGLHCIGSLHLKTGQGAGTLDRVETGPPRR